MIYLRSLVGLLIRLASQNVTGLFIQRPRKSLAGARKQPDPESQVTAAKAAQRSPEPEV